MAFGGDCVTGGAVGSSEKEGALPMRFAGWLGGQKGPLWHWILMGEYGNVAPHILPYRFDKSRQPVL